MPGMDGMDVLRRIRALPNPPPTAVLTAVPTAANTIEAMRLGAVDHLAKPIGRADLQALITRMLPADAARPTQPPPEPDEDTLVGGSSAMRTVQKAIGMLADSDATAARLLAHTWPGNVRELRNAMERVATLGRREIIAAEDLNFLQGATQEAPPETNLPAAIANLEQTMIRQALAATAGNRTEAAKRLAHHPIVRFPDTTVRNPDTSAPKKS
eukprot:gene11492-11588_t